MKKYKPLIIGIIGGTGLLAVYFTVSSIFNNAADVFYQFMKVWYWVIILAAGFGVHLGLFIYAMEALKQKKTPLTAEVAASGTVSTGSMIACCAHHIADLLPFLGLSAAAVFLTKFYIPLILTGIFFNLTGITVILNTMQKHRLYKEGYMFRNLFKMNMKVLRNIAAVLLLTVVPISFFFSAQTGNVNSTEASKIYNLPEKNDSRNGLSISVKPEKYSKGVEIKFTVRLNTHSGSVDFDMTNAVILRDDLSNSYIPLKWVTVQSGEHHKSGTLIFQEVKREAKAIVLIFKELYDVPERIFTWEIK